MTQQHIRAADSELIEQSRGGSTEAYAELWRRHQPAGLKAARSLAPTLDADDLVAEAFVRILTQLNKGNGPSGGFRSYLYAVIRSVAVDTYRSTGDEVTVEAFEDLPGLADGSMEITHSFNLSATKSAYESLPQRDQEVLWYTEVEALPPRKAAQLLGMTAPATATLAMRARNRLRDAWLLEHARDPALPLECRRVVGNFAKYHKGRLTQEERAAVDAHVDGCTSCAEILRESERVYGSPGGLIAASVLGVVAAGALDFSAVAIAPAAAALTTGIGAKIAVGTVTVTVIGALVGAIALVSQHNVPEAAPRPETAEHGEHPNGTPASPPATEEDEQEQSASGTGQDDAPLGAVPAEIGGGVPDTLQPSGNSSGAGAPPRNPEDARPSTPVPQAPAPVAPAPTTPSERPLAPAEPSPPDLLDNLPQTLPALEYSVLTGSDWRLGVMGNAAEPGATIRLRVTSQPLADATYGVVMETRAWNNGYWAFGNVGGLTPLNVTVEVQQLTAVEASPWATVVSNQTYPLTLAALEPGNYSGRAAWYAQGWPGAHWALREVGADWPLISGQFLSGGGAVVPVPGDIPRGESREYEVGYWIGTRFAPNGAVLTVQG